MRDKELYSKILGVETPWYVANVELSIADGKVEVFLSTMVKSPLNAVFVINPLQVTTVDRKSGGTWIPASFKLFSLPMSRVPNALNTA